jgi:hypothetical protein
MDRWVGKAKGRANARPAACPPPSGLLDHGGHGAAETVIPGRALLGANPESRAYTVLDSGSAPSRRSARLPASLVLWKDSRNRMQFSKRAPGTIHKKFVRTESAKKIPMRVIRANLKEPAASFNEGRATNALVGADVPNNFNAGASAAAILIGGARLLKQAHHAFTSTSHRNRNRSAKARRHVRASGWRPAKGAAAGFAWFRKAA